MTHHPTQPGADDNPGAGPPGPAPHPVTSPQPVGAREWQFPEHDHDGTELILTTATAPPPTRNPYLVYLATVADGESRRAMAGCLDRITGL